MRLGAALAVGLVWLAFSGCGGQTEGGAGSAELCRLPPVAGNCTAYFPRYYFNAASGKCERFVYGGCGGNANNFETIDACAQACAPASTSDACGVTQCPSGERCVYFSDSAACAPPCDPSNDTCGIGTVCSCGSSCRGCDDCLFTCKPAL